MLYVTLQGYDLRYDLEHLLNTFYKREDLVFISENENEEIEIKEEKIDVLSVTSQLHGDTMVYMVGAAFDADPSEEMPWETKSGEILVGSDEHEAFRKLKQEIKRTVYDYVSSKVKSTSPWGILVGMRPVKLVHEMLDTGMTPEVVGLKLRDDYRVSNEKIELALQIADVERPYLESASTDPISLYICIPFCPTRCLYCSFPSNAMGQKGKLMDPYLDALIKEIKEVSEMIDKSLQRVDCIYIGGGTPTSLSESQLERLLHEIETQVGTDKLVEYTVEAGRPDSITEDKLKIMKKYGVDRICINPQTMNDDTLTIIGREHNKEDIRSVYEMAKNIGFKSINMDLIIGLPGETARSVEETMAHVGAMRPENVTLHTLAIKRSSRLNQTLQQKSGSEYELSSAGDAEKMMEIAMASLYGMEMHPYYMYRQKKILANLENVGFCKEGHESVYNIRIMEERHQIVALGAGAASKMVYLNENRFERVANTKGVEDYIERVDEMIEKKRPYLLGEKSTKA